MGPSHTNSACPVRRSSLRGAERTHGSQTTPPNAVAYRPHHSAHPRLPRTREEKVAPESTLEQRKRAARCCPLPYASGLPQAFGGHLKAQITSLCVPTRPLSLQRRRHRRPPTRRLPGHPPCPYRLRRHRRYRIRRPRQSPSRRRSPPSTAPSGRREVHIYPVRARAMYIVPQGACSR